MEPIIDTTYVSIFNNIATEQVQETLSEKLRLAQNILCYIFCLTLLLFYSQ